MVTLNAFFRTFAPSYPPLHFKPMIIDINNDRKPDSDGGDGVLLQVSPLVLMVRKVVNSCKAMSSYEAATAMLLEMFDVVLTDAAALAELKRGKEEVRAFFEQRNTPQPSTKIEGCNIFTGDTTAEQIVGKSGFTAKTTTINGDNTMTDHFNDGQVACALMACVGQGKVIDAKWKWAGAHWCLRWVCNYPVDPQKFCEKIDSLKLWIPAGYECSYESIRKICTLSFMDYDARRMDTVRVSKNDQGIFSQCREIFLKITAELEKNSLPKE